MFGQVSNHLRLPFFRYAAALPGRRLLAPVLLLAALTGAILLGVHFFLNDAIKRAVENHARMDAMAWAQGFEATLPANAESLLTGNALSSQQSEVINAAMSFANAYAFNVYDAQGRIQYTADHGVVENTEKYPVNETAAQVAASGGAQVAVIERNNPAGGASVFVDAYVPANHSGGEVLGVIHLYMDKSDIAAPYKDLLEWIGSILPILFALVYALPVLAYVWKREETFSQKEHLRIANRQDALTGALNRKTLNAEIKERFADRARYSGIGIFFLDVDKFKNINDLHGHEFGDAFLAHIASLLITQTRSGDLVGRMGGDEFVVAMPNISEADLERIGDRILSEAQCPFSYRGTTIQASVSIGQYLAGVQSDAKQSLHAADLALYHAKSLGRNIRQPYFRELDVAMLRRREVESRIREVLDKSDFDIHYQPLVAQCDREIVGFEALLRISDRQGGPISPDEFIPVAEEAGLIQGLGWQMFNKAITTAKRWPENIGISINLSPAQFKSGDVDEMVERLLAQHDFPASRLELEITESLLIGDEECVSNQLAALKRLGVSIAMDDFGTGYSSLGYLWKYDFDKLKIDRVFLEGFDFENTHYKEIIETISTLGRKLGMKVTVEGVENQRHTEMLDQLACDFYQGYYFGRPMLEEDTLRMVLRQEARVAEA